LWKPAADFIQPNTFGLAGHVATMPHGTAVDRGTSALGVLRYMRDQAQVPHLGHEVLRVIGFVSPKGNWVGAVKRADHGAGSLAFLRQFFGLAPCTRSRDGFRREASRFVYRSI
jgi:hypothetical protein